MKPSIENVIQCDEYLEARDSAILALEYIIKELQTNNAHDIAEALSDVVNLYSNVKRHSDLIQGVEEYQDILHMYLMLKYHSKIKLDKYKQKAFSTLASQRYKNGKNTL